MNMAAHNMRYEPMREAPVNLDAEWAILGALMMNNGARTDIPTSFQSGHFSEPFHRELFEAFDRGVKSGRSMNPVTIRSFLSPAFQEQKVGDLTVPQYLARLVSEAATIGMVKEYAEAITDFHFKREAISIGQTVELAGFNSKDELEFTDSITEARDRFNEILAEIARRNEPEENFFDAIDVTDHFTADAMAGRKPLGLYPGLPELEHLIGGYQKGQLIIIGGGVKQGKSALAWQSFFEVARKHTVAGNSGEMPREQIIMREKARRTGISTNRQKSGKVSDREMEELVMAGAEMKRLKIAEINCQRLTIDQLDQRIHRLVNEKGIEAYFLDHIGKLAWTGKMEHEDEFKQGQRATSMLKDMAMKHGIPVIALTHLKKSAFQEYGGKSFRDRLKTAMFRRPNYRDLVGNMDKDADHVVIPFQARPIIAGMEPEEGTADYEIWQTAMDQVAGKAEIILSLSREREFPKRRDIIWNGSTTSYGPDYKAAANDGRLL